MRRAAIVILAVLAVAIVASELFLPGFAARRAEDRLTRGGGTAEVTVEALPAVRLLFGDGDRIVARARNVNLPAVELSDKLLDRLDGFDEVDIELRNADAVPFRLHLASLTRKEGSDHYQLDATATATGRELADFAGGALGGPLGGLAARIGAGALPLTDEPVPVNLHARLVSEDGRPRVDGAEGTVAGLPAGPFAEVIAGAILGRFAG